MTSPLQLPPNAWRNAKSWGDSDFPVNVVPGDRILRTDGYGGNISPVWWTYIEYLGTGYWVPDCVGGNLSFNATASNLITLPVSFGFTWPTPPRVFANVNGGVATGSFFPAIVDAVSVNTTGCLIRVRSSTGPTGTMTFTQLPVVWIAFPS